MSLSKNYTAQKVIDIIRILLNEITTRNLKNKQIREFINTSVLKFYTLQSEANMNLYSTPQVIADSSSVVQDSTNVESGATYTNSTKLITMAAHGLSQNDVGKAIIYFTLSDKFVRSQIATVIDADTFTVSHAAGEDMTSVYYIVFPFHTSTSVDISSYAVDEIIRLHDSSIGRIINIKDPGIFFDLAEHVGKQNRAYYYYEGDTIFLYLGTNLDGFGTLTMYYNRVPNLVSLNADYLDVPDQWVPFVIQLTKAEVYETLSMKVPEDVKAFIEDKTRKIREAVMSKEKKAEETQ